MKGFIVFIIGISFISFRGSAQSFENIDATGFKKLVDAGEGIILDVRTPAEVAKGHIAGCTAINVADPNFSTKINFIQKDKPIYIYCMSGARSVKAANIMAQNGFKKIFNLQKGLIEWKQSDFPLEKSADAVPSTSVQYTGESFTKILQENKMVLLDFYAPWCAPCKKMMPDIDKLSEQYKGKIEIIKADIEVNDAIAKTYQVQSVPCLLLFKKGKQEWRNNGALSFDAIEAVIKKNL